MTKNPTDATIRNVKASKKRDEIQNARIKALEVRMRAVEEKVAKLAKDLSEFRI